MYEDKIPLQMSEYEVYERLLHGECPINISIDKFKMFKEWCEYLINDNDLNTLKWYAALNSSNCALCIVNLDNCAICVLSKIEAECCPDKATISPWYRVKYATNFVDETEERQKELYSAIDNMIETLERCKEIE